MTIPDKDLAVLLLDAFRYCLGRRTYAVGEYAEILTTHWAIVPKPWQELIHREIKQAIESHCAGDGCDEAVWRNVLGLPLSE